MIEIKTLPQLAHPWRTDAVPLPPDAVAAAPVAAADPPAERSVFGLAAELKNLVREDRIYRASRKRPLS